MEMGWLARLTLALGQLACNLLAYRLVNFSLQGAETMGLGGKAPITHIIAVRGGDCSDFSTQIGIAFDESRCEIGEQTRHILGNQYLAVTSGGCADADGRHLKAL